MEVTADAIKTILVEHLQAELTAIDADQLVTDTALFGATLGCTAPASDDIFIGIQPVISQFPAIEIAPSLDNDEAMEKEFEVWWHILDWPDGQSERVNMRLQKGILNVLKNHATLDGASHDMKITPAKYNRWTDGEMFFRGGMMRVTCLVPNEL